MTEKRHQNYRCAMEASLSVISGKWKMTILQKILAGPIRYSDIKHNIPDITEKMLTQQLRELEEDGIVKRKVYPVVPPKVEYSFTDLGQGLTPIFQSLEVWGAQFLTNSNGELITPDSSCYVAKSEAVVGVDGKLEPSRL
ncbi:winged helix-turn-helix transcriptional regulator [Mucilaginibacter jinjuensis]|uniref:Helix-turn-helix domain-containing protein n=1 Tax=Mucilaginibacter jinjuensis TaxID=1176721 RepID=A0ABY7TFW7_9SPHI|nr:helix-turn-helix domain-containing protein [Mucilaginibacter jinjuensis]WCT14047.1 helix-turn-helix domain-containing protein [Mucilaginibacter jinjuensis]